MDNTNLTQALKNSQNSHNKIEISPKSISMTLSWPLLNTEMILELFGGITKLDFFPPLGTLWGGTFSIVPTVIDTWFLVSLFTFIWVLLWFDFKVFIALNSKLIYLCLPYIYNCYSEQLAWVQGEQWSKCTIDIKCPE